MAGLGAGAGRRGYYYGWNIVSFCIVAAIVSNGVAMNCFGLFLKPWAADFHSKVSTLQLGIACTGGVCALFGPIIGTMADRFPARILFAVGFLVFGVANLGVSIAHSATQVILMFAIPMPIAIGLTTSINANALVSRWFVKRLGLALGLTAFGLSVGGIIAPPFISVALPSLGWRTIYQISAGAGMVVCLIALFVVRDRPTEREGLDYLIADSAGPVRHHGHGGGSATTAITWRQILARRNFWLVVVTYLPILALYSAVLQNLGPIVTNRHMGQETAGVMVSVFNTAHMLATLIVGMLADRLGNRRLLFALGILAAAGGLVAAFSTSLSMLVLAAVLTGCGGAFWPLIAGVLAIEFHDGVGKAFGAATFFLPFAVLSPVLVSRLQESTGSYLPGFAILAGAATLGGTVALFIREAAKPSIRDGMAAG